MNFADTSMDALATELKGTAWEALGASAGSVLSRFEATASIPPSWRRRSSAPRPRAGRAPGTWPAVGGRQLRADLAPTAVQDFVIRKSMGLDAIRADYVAASSPLA